MALFDVNESQAREWCRKAEELNERTKTAMNMVGTCLQEIQSESTGEMVDQLVLTGAQVLDATARLTESLSAVKNALEEILSMLANAVMNAVDIISGNRTNTTNFS